MGLLDRLLGRPDPSVKTTLQMINGYSPAFTSRGGSIYESELIRSSVDAFARHVSKLKAEVITPDEGSHAELARMLSFRPNPWQTASQFQARVANILEIDTVALLIPITSPDGGKLTGIYAVLPRRCELREDSHTKVLWLVYSFADGTTAAIEFDRVGILVKFQYEHDLFGSGNAALNSTLDVMHANEEGVVHGIKSSARVRFIARLVSSLKTEDVKKERQRFVDDNLSIANDAGVIMVDNKYADIVQVKAEQYLIDDKQSEQIRNRVYSYFGTNEDIIQNRYDESVWGAYYEGKIEPFATDLSQVVTHMVFSPRERERGCEVVYSSSRLQYASLKTKIQFAQMMTDRGQMNGDESRAVFGYGPMPDGLGQAYYIRGEYINVKDIDAYKMPVQPKSTEPKEQDDAS